MKLAVLLGYLFSLAATQGNADNVPAAPVIKVPAVLNVSDRTACVQKPGVVYGRKSERQRVEATCLPTGKVLQQQDANGTISLTAIRAIWRSLIPTLEVVGNDRIQLIRSVPLSSADLSLQAQRWLESQLQGRFESVVVEVDGTTPVVLGAIDALQWEVRKSDVFPKRRMCVWMDGTDDGRIQKSVPLCFRVQASTSVPVYGRDLAANDVLDPVRIDLKTVEVTSLPDIPAEFDPAKQYMATAPVQAGEVLLAGDVRPRPEVIQGRPVTILSQVGGVSVVVRGTALEEGRIGDTVRVKMDQGNESFRARVEGADKVKIGGEV